jgi:hypothetical protein
LPEDRPTFKDISVKLRTLIRTQAQAHL